MTRPSTPPPLPLLIDLNVTVEAKASSSYTRATILNRLKDLPRKSTDHKVIEERKFLRKLLKKTK